MTPEEIRTHLIAYIDKALAAHQDQTPKATTQKQALQVLLSKRFRFEAPCITSQEVLYPTLVNFLSEDKLEILRNLQPGQILAWFGPLPGDNIDVPITVTALPPVHTTPKYLHRFLAETSQGLTQMLLDAANLGPWEKTISGIHRRFFKDEADIEAIVIVKKDTGKYLWRVFPNPKDSSDYTWGYRNTLGGAKKAALQALANHVGGIPQP